MDRTLSTCFSKTFGKHSSCSRSIRGVRKAYGTQHLQIFIPNAPRTRCMLPERFPYMPYAPRILPNTSRIHMDATFGWSMIIILNMHNKLLELPNAVPYASVRSRTASMLLDHTDCFPNMIRSLPKHPNSYSENKRNGFRASVIGPIDWDLGPHVFQKLGPNSTGGVHICLNPNRDMRCAVWFRMLIGTAKCTYNTNACMSHMHAFTLYWKSITNSYVYYNVLMVRTSFYYSYQTASQMMR